MKAAPDPESGYREEYYPDATEPGEAIPISVSAGSTTPGIHFTLESTTPPTPTPPVTLGVQLDMPSTMYRPGDIFYLNANVMNPGAPLGQLPLLVVLDVFGRYYFWPGWKCYDPPEQPEFDYSYIDVITGLQVIPVLPSFTWPDTGSGKVNGLYFHAALLSASFDDIVGNMDSRQFGYGP